MRRLVLVVFAVVSLACAAIPGSTQPTVLRVVLADDWASAPLVTQVIERFEEDHPGVRVQVQATPFSQIPDQVAQGVELGQQPDVAHWHAFAAAAIGMAEPLDALWDQFDLDADDYLPGALEGVTWQDERYGVPLDVNALVLMANPALLDDADVTARELATPERFREAAHRLRTDTPADHAIAVTASSWAAYGWITAGGGDLIDGVDEDGLPILRFDDAATVDALALLVDLIRSGDAPPPFAPDLAIDAIASFSNGETALHASGSWDLPTTRRALQAELPLAEVEVLPLPQADPDAPRTVLGGSSLFVPLGAAEPELAVAFMRALTEDEVAGALAAEEGRLPARSRVYDDPLFTATPDVAAFVEQLETARVMPLIAYPEVSTAFRDGLEAALSGRRTPDGAMRDVQQAADRWLERQRDELGEAGP
ncbi:MAG: extracellular solute-binding protein [Nitriliruptoraceae bacterium]|nr:extracellular solute-binding protein [Nitriliruptoraceae bacterium]